jgi:4-diphosphocytidyl-2-C-methyl-D-erythritol kinase
MLTFPNCKINLGLNIIGKRADGFHNIETIFYPIAIKDALEIVADESATTEITFTTSGLVVQGNDADNLCIKAYHLLKKDFHQIPAVKMHLHKNIPMGAGMGGGSADGAAVLTMLNKKFELQINTEKLIENALLLGSDCPFFIVNKPSFASGRGEILQEINIDLSSYKIMIVNPGIHVNTGDAFKSIDVNNFSASGLLQQNILKDITTWKECIKNDFEIPVFVKHPAIKEIKDTLYENGAIYAAMSGTGSTVYGIFDKENVASLKFPTQYFCQVV